MIRLDTKSQTPDQTDQRKRHRRCGHLNEITLDQGDTTFAGGFGSFFCSEPSLPGEVNIASPICGTNANNSFSYRFFEQ